MIALGISKTGEQIRRAQASFNRLLLRNVDAVRKVQREDDRGWEIVRKAREEKKVLRRNQDKRETQTVSDSDLRGLDLESADPYATEMAEMQRRAEARVEREIAAEQAEAERARAKLKNEAMTAAVTPDDDVTLIVTGTGAQENNRNEIGDAELASGMVEDDEAWWEEDDEVLPYEGVLEGVQVASSGAVGKEVMREGKKRISGPPDMVDESLEGIDWLLPNTVRFLKEQRALL